jgi:DNA invertase Pin-like site-specific DNA recombinase
MTFETIRTMLVGYARVSTSEQTLDLQKDALEKIGCVKIYSDVVSGAKAERKGLQEALEYVREGDTLVVWRLDRLERSLKHLIETITKLNNRKIGFKPTFKGYWSTVMIFRLDLALRVTQTSSLRQKCLS